MGTIDQPLPVRLFMAVMYDEAVAIDSIWSCLDSQFGVRPFSHGPVPFSWSDYYAPEMGTGLVKVYCCYEQLIDRARLPEIKVLTNGIEQDFAVAGRRRVNIDPGYIARDKLVLASTKDFYHRLYLGSGIFGEVTLHFRKGAFRHFSWTYPDYQDSGVQQLLVRARAALVGEIRKE
ncbi:MAG: DUF4416 family protein [Chitinispirillaceae bacterium]|jgi:hypothetical protein|nr:DUF4416 family protein [Chitinispirillaceae bacterium]